LVPEKIVLTNQVSCLITEPYHVENGGNSSKIKSKGLYRFSCTPKNRFTPKGSPPFMGVNQASKIWLYSRYGLSFVGHYLKLAAIIRCMHGHMVGPLFQEYSIAILMEQY